MQRTSRLHRTTSLATLASVALLSAPLMGCDSSRAAPPPAVDDSRSARNAPMAPSMPTNTAPAAPAPTGMSTRTKMIVLGGAAALYYLYKHHENAPAKTGEEGQYYLSKNGRVYYRDAENRAHWVTPPAEGIQVPEAEAQPYRQFQGYDNSAAGQDLSNMSQGIDP